MGAQARRLQIWKRFTASRMSAARYETTSVRIVGHGKKNEHVFTVAASHVLFDGFMSAYTDEEEEGINSGMMKGLDEKSILALRNFNALQHFTQPSPHYTEASLVRALEEQGIGRPSTYAPTITTILARRYVAKEEKNLYMTELGEVVNDMMKKAFPSIVDTSFTANLENLLDGVADGSVKWKTIIENFYPDLDTAVKNAEKELAELESQQNSTEEFRKNIEAIRATLRMAERDTSGGGITKEFVDKYIDKIFVTPESDGSMRLEIKIFTGDSTEKYLHNLASRSGHMSKKMIQSYENGMK